MIKMSYTEEQLRGIKENLTLISRSAMNILETIINEPNINHSEIYIKAGLSKFVTDKCISAFLVAGIVERVDDGVKRSYKVTDDGQKLLKLN